ncbi:MAG: Holliday junction resolvase RuvX [Acidobacteriota bacterium]
MTQTPSADGRPGRVLGVDLGARRIGLALSDELRLTVRPLGVVNSRGARRDATAIRQAVGEDWPVQLVVGLPLLPSGDEGDSAVAARERGLDLGRRLQLPVAFVDEAYSTVTAQERIDAGARGELDALAAAVIVEDYLADQGRVSP